MTVMLTNRATNLMVKGLAVRDPTSAPMFFIGHEIPEACLKCRGLVRRFDSAGARSFRSTDFATSCRVRVVRCCVCLSIALAFSQPAYAQQPDTVPGVGAIAREMPIDLWRYLSLDTAIVLGAGGAAAGIAHIW